MRIKKNSIKKQTEAIEIVKDLIINKVMKKDIYPLKLLTKFVGLLVILKHELGRKK